MREKVTQTRNDSEVLAGKYAPVEGGGVRATGLRADEVTTKTTADKVANIQLKMAEGCNVPGSWQQQQQRQKQQHRGQQQR